MAATNQQVSIVRKELSKHGKQRVAAAKAGMCRQTAAKYQRLGKLPSELKSVRDWLTREDHFAGNRSDPSLEMGAGQRSGFARDLARSGDDVAMPSIL